MTFTQPFFLWALAGMIVPLAIHLLSRKEGKIVKVGSLRHMEESNTSRFKSVRINEILLLLARCLMIIWLSLFLSGAACTTSNTVSNSNWLVLEKGIDREPSMRSLIDSLTASGYELRYLASGFPKAPPTDIIQAPDYWSAAEKLGEMRDHEIVVVCYNRANGFKLNRPSLPSNIRWIPVNPTEVKFVVQAKRLTNDSVAVRTAHSDAKGTNLTTKKSLIPNDREWITIDGFVDSVRIDDRDTVLVSIAHDDEHKADAQLLRAAINALDLIPTMVILEVDSERAQWLFWLRDDEPQVSAELKSVLMRPQDNANWIGKVGKSTWHLTRRLTPDEVLRNHFTIELAKTLLADTPLPEELLAKNVASLPEQMSWSSMATEKNLDDRIPLREGGIILIILFVLTWVSERALAIRKNL